MEKIIKNIFLSIMLISSSTLTHAATFSNLIIFGDSLSDSGQFGAGLNGSSTTLTDPDSAFDFGEVWTTGFARKMRLGGISASSPIDNPYSFGTNYSIPGHRAAQVYSTIVDKGAAPGLSVMGNISDLTGPITGATVVLADPATGTVFGLNSRDGYLAQFQQADPQALYVVWAGGNDMRDIRDARAVGGSAIDLHNSAQTTVNSVIASVNALNDAGANYILVVNQPNIGGIPESDYLSAATGNDYNTAGTEAASSFNNTLLQEIPNTGANVIPANIYKFMGELLADLPKYGLANTNNCYSHLGVGAGPMGAGSGIPCNEDPTFGHSGTSPNSSNLTFFDGIHPSQVAHDMMEDYFASLINGPGQASLLPILGLSSLKHQQIVLNNLAELQMAKDYSLTPFVSTTSNSSRLSTADPSYNFTNNERDINLGLKLFMAKNIDVAFLSSRAHNTAHFSLGGEVTSNYTHYALISNYKNRFFNANVSGFYGISEYDMNRTLLIGTALLNHTGDTKGKQYGFSANIGREFEVNRLKLDGKFGVNNVVASVDPLTEVQDLSSSLSYRSQIRKSTTLTARIAGDYYLPIGRIKVNAGASGELELRGKDTDIYSMVNSMPGILYHLPASPLPDNQYSVFVLLSKKIMPHLTIAGGYNFAMNNINGSSRLINIGFKLE